MADVTPEERERVLAAVRDVQNYVGKLKAVSRPPKGYIGFQLAEAILVALHQAVQTDSKRELLATWLKRADGALQLVQGGDAAPAVQRAHLALEALWTELERW